MRRRERAAPTAQPAPVPWGQAAAAVVAAAATACVDAWVADDMVDLLGACEMERAGAATMATQIGIAAAAAAASQAPFVWRGAGRRARAAAVLAAAAAAAALWCLWGMFSGTHASSAPAAPPVAVTAVMVSLRRNAARRAPSETRLAAAGIDAAVVEGVDGRAHANVSSVLAAFGVPASEADHRLPPDHAGRASLVLNMRAVLAAAAAAAETDDAPAQWVLVLEDDAWPRRVETFVREMSEAAAAFEDADLIWLDTRNSPEWAFARRSAGAGCAGVMYRGASLRRVLEVMDWDGDFYRASRARLGYVTMDDTLLAEACNGGVLRCAAAPIVRQSCAPSSLVAPAPVL